MPDTAGRTCVCESSRVPPPSSSSLDLRDERWLDGALGGRAMAQLARRHGAGRFALDDDIDPHVGFVIQTPFGAYVDKNKPLFTFHHTQPLEEAEVRLLKAMCTVGDDEPKQTERLLEVIDFASTKA